MGIRNRSLFFIRWFHGAVVWAAPLLLLSADGVSAQENYSTWSDSQRIYINTTSSGANVGGTVSNFPVLVRLNSSNFTRFSRTKSGGADIRFASSSGTHLNYQIEQWVDGTQAEIWVKVPSVTGNNNTQFIRMYYGNADAADSSNGQLVFETSNGFMGVWHLSEDPGGGTGAIKDATSNRLNATARGGMSSADRVNGAIGKAHDFDGVDDGDSIPYAAALNTADAVTLSAWVYVRRFQMYSRIISRGMPLDSNPWTVYSLNTHDTTPRWRGEVSAGDTGTQYNVQGVGNLSVNTWYHVAFTYDRSNLKMFRNGVQDSISIAGTNAITATQTTPLMIGKSNYNATNQFNGVIDEAVVSRVARSADWIKLSYQTQRPSATCVQPQNTALPTITTQPVGASVQEGANVSMTVVASANYNVGTNVLRYAWYKNSVGPGNIITGQTNATLSLRDVQAADSGNYYVVVSNEYGSVTSNAARLIVSSQDTPPTITLQPHDTTVFATQPATFTVAATGPGMLSYQWYKVVGGQNTAIAVPATGLTTPTMTITSVQGTDSGLYRCVVSNDYGNTPSNTAKLTVLSGAPTITVQPRDTIVLATQPASFTVTATGAGTLKYDWFKNVVDESTRIPNQTTRTLSFASVTFTDSGNYICEVTNDYGWVQSRAAKLTVNDGRPVITKHPRDTMVLENSAWTMSVTATGQPTLSYAWYKTGNPPIKLGTNNRVLTVSSALLSDAGSYYCIVSNTFGACTSNVGNLSVSRNQQVSNPIQLSGQLIDSTNVLLTISRYDDLPTTAEPGFPWYADTVMVWYRVALFPAPPPNRTTANFKFLVTALKAAGTAFQTIVTVPKLATCQNYCFKGSVNWRNTQLMRDSIPPFGLDASGARVYMCDTTRIANPLTMAFNYTAPNSYVTVTITGLEDPGIRWDLAQYLILGHSINTTTSFIDSLIVPAAIPAGDTCDIVVSNPQFASVPATVNWRLYFKGIYGNRSDTIKGACIVGADRPDNTLSLLPGDIGGSQVQLLWTNAGEPYDSLKVWYGTSPMPDDNPQEGVFSHMVIPGTDASTYVRGLKSLTDYYFGIQGARQGLWSAIPAPAKASARTIRDTTVAILNTVSLDSISFDTANPGYIRIHYSVNQDPPGFQVQVGFSWLERSIDNPPQPEEFLEPSTSPKVGAIKYTDEYRTALTYDIKIADASPLLEYGKQYYFGLWLGKAGEKFGPPTDSSTRHFVIPQPPVIPVVIFKDAPAIQAFNNSVILMRIDEIEVPATLRKLALPFENSGLVQVSTSAFSLETSSSSRASLWVGLEYNPGLIPAPAVKENIRMYRYDAAQNLWFLDTGTLVDDPNGLAVLYIQKSLLDCTLPFVLAVDIQPPVLTVTSDVATPVSPGNQIDMHLVVVENIANPVVSLHAGEGKDLLIMHDTLEGQVPAGESDWIIPSTMVQGETGIRAYFSVDDYRFTQVLDVSRDILFTNSDVIIPPEEEWTPLGATAVLDAPGVQQALDEFATPEGGWKYDIFSMRLFRFMQHDWMEYSDAGKENFTFVPGRVIWLKTRDPKAIDFGTGRSVSLKAPYTITLPGKSWTDFCLPYRFDIRIGDIVNSTDIAVRQVLQFYEWHKDETQNNRYVADWFYLPLNDGMHDPTRRVRHVQDNGDKAAYTVWNDLNDTVELRIPSIPTALSTIYLFKGAAVSEGWSVAVRAKVADGNLSPIFCAYVQGSGGTLAYPLPPSWSKVHVGIFDKQRKGVYGNVIVRELVNGGYAYELVFENESQDRTRVSYNVERLAAPRDIEIALIDPSSGTAAPGESQLSLEVAGKSREYRLLAIGTPKYIDGFGRSLRRGEFGITRIAPNPFKNSLRIQYTVPYGGLEAIRCDIIDQLGRIVWTARPGKAIHPGTNTILWTASDGKPLAAGAYFVRLVGFDGKGRRTGENLARIMYLP